MADGGGPTEQDRSEGTLSLSEGPNERGKIPLVTLGLFSKVTRCKSETNSSRYRRNGYTPNQSKVPAPDDSASKLQDVLQGKERDQ
jgi:hypothetical protein